jgi:hypothetical protein
MNVWEPLRRCLIDLYLVPGSGREAKVSQAWTEPLNIDDHEWKLEVGMGSIIWKRLNVVIERHWAKVHRNSLYCFLNF